MTADIVVCVHDALADTRRCLESLARHTAAQHAIIVVDDGSNPACHDLLVRFTQERPRAALIHHRLARGYTGAANQGLRQSRSDFVVLLNSDTVVTSSWLERLLECAASDARIGLVGPLSNAGGYQSVPEGVSGDDFPRNPLPPGWDVEQVASVVDAVSTRAFPRVGFLNGFCLGIKRAVIEHIGFLDEEAFPQAYGEETDYCLRAAAAGFSLAIADHAYVYHAKTKSYTRRQRHDLSQAGEDVLRGRHGSAYAEARKQLRAERSLAAMRERVGAYLAQTCPFPVGADAVSSSPSDWTTA